MDRRVSDYFFFFRIIVICSEGKAQRDPPHSLGPRWTLTHGYPLTPAPATLMCQSHVGRGVSAITIRFSRH